MTEQEKQDMVVTVSKRLGAYCLGAVFDEEIRDTVGRVGMGILRKAMERGEDEEIAFILRSDLMDIPEVRLAATAESAARAFGEPKVDYGAERSAIESVAAKEAKPEIVGVLNGAHEARAGSTSDSPEVVGVLDAIQRKRMLDALERLSTAKSDEDQRVAANEIAKEKFWQDSFDEMVFVVATGKTPEQYTAERVRAAQKDIEAATEMHDVPLGGKQEDLAAFEIHTLGERGLITVSHKIYADGRTEGFPPASLIINRIPSLEAAAFSRGNRWKS